MGWTIHCIINLQLLPWYYVVDAVRFLVNADLHDVHGFSLRGQQVFLVYHPKLTSLITYHALIVPLSTDSNPILSLTVAGGAHNWTPQHLSPICSSCATNFHLTQPLCFSQYRRKQPTMGRKDPRSLVGCQTFSSSPLMKR
eukprot:g40513.t1